MSQMLYMTDEAVVSGYGLPFSLFGFATVFFVLALIMFVIIIFGKIFGTAAENKPSKKAPAPKKEVKVETVPVAQTVESIPVSNDAAIVAAITAAISAYRSSTGEGSFRVVSFKKRK